MASRKAVLLNLWGGVVTSRPMNSFQKFEKTHKLPRSVLSLAIENAGSDSALCQAERGQLTLTEMISKLEVECMAQVGKEDTSLPSEFSLQDVFKEIRDTASFIKPILKAVAILRNHGCLTAVLANHWVDDTAQRGSTARLLSALGGSFDLVLQSCRVGHRVQEPAMFTTALQKLGVKAQQVIWLDVVEDSFKAAESVGITTFLIEEIDKALMQLRDFTGVEALTSVKAFPEFCHPESLSHGSVSIRSGVKTHYVEMGDGPPVLLCHGFPESWFSWRYQIPALARAGYRVLALDMKGYGGSTAPPDIEEYSQEQICQDLVTFMDILGLPQVTLVGHDWGGVLVWNMAQFHPERVRAVASLNTPLFPVDPNIPPMARIKAVPIFDYQLYFQQPGLAEAELEKNLERTFKLFFYGSEETDRPGLQTSGVIERGGLFVGAPENVTRSAILSEEALKYYIQQFTNNGFRRPLNWYRNVEKNWLWMCSRPRPKILMPALMITAGKDPVLLPVFSDGMEAMVPNLTRGHIKECGHWTQMEKPSEVNDILIAWLKDKTAGATEK